MINPLHVHRFSVGMRTTPDAQGQIGVKWECECGLRVHSITEMVRVSHAARERRKSMVTVLGLVALGLLILWWL